VDPNTPLPLLIESRGGKIAQSVAPRFTIWRHVAFGTFVMCLLVAGIAGWAAEARISGAVIAPATFVVNNHVKKVQHRDGGIVAEINVKNGDLVRAGDVLLRLDATQTRAEISIIHSQLAELTARNARLSAESEGRTEIEFPGDFLAQGEEPRRAAEGERRLFEHNSVNNESRREQLKLRIAQLNEEIKGLGTQRDAKEGELDLIQLELSEVRKLSKKSLTPISRVYAMERDEQRLSGEYGGLIAQMARAGGQIGEINLQILAIDQTARTDAQRELRLIESKISELKEREIAARDRLNRIDVRAPLDGIVHELSVHTVGGVITSAEQLLLIVPEKDDLAIEVRFASTDIDQIAVGSEAKLRLSAFNQRTTPELDGHIVQVSADASVDQKTGQHYYVGRIEMDEKSRRTIGDLKLIPGMPVEVFVSTGERTALSYLVKPVTDQMSRAFRE
jgi:HlyD family secretion protein